MKTFEVNRTIFPNENFTNNTNLFFNITNSKALIKESFTDVIEYKTNTWMNIFPAKKIFEYCNINDLYLNLKINKKAVLRIFGFNYNEAFDNDELIVTQEIQPNKEYTLQIDNPENYENIYYSLICDTDSKLNVKKSSWVTTTPPIRKTKLALITCTYKRENYVKRNIELFNNFISDNKFLSDDIKMIIVDNGQTLDKKEIENESIKLYPNKNAGGAGGFTRGIIEAKNSDENYTRVLLMDDDIEFLPETFYRTIVISNYLKNEYKNAFIHGAMLDLYKKNIFYESDAIQTKDWVSSYHGILDISKQKDIAKANYTPNSIFYDKNAKISSAWWYCCFTIESVHKNGLPLPVFFQGDDIEWSWRNFGEVHISMNGICVWHAPFAWRVSKNWYYFGKRNIYMANMIYTSKYQKVLLKTLKRTFSKLLKQLDYTTCSLYIKMMSDLIKGPDVFRKDPQILLKEVSEYLKNDIIKSDINTCTVADLAWRFENYVKAPKKYRKRRLLKNIMYNLTFNGKLYPKFLWKKRYKTWSDSPPDVDFILTKEVHVYNFLKNNYEIRTYDSKKENQLKNEFSKNFNIIKHNYDNIKANYIQMQKEFSTETFWKEYLGI